MQIGILIVGVVIVVGGILVLRLHAFLALTLAALVVALLTPAANVEEFFVQTGRVKGVEILAAGKYKFPVGAAIETGDRFLLRTTTDGKHSWLPVKVVSVEGPKKRMAVGELEPGFAADTLPQTSRAIVLVAPSVVQAAKREAGKTIGERVGGAFGTTCAKIGILIAMAAVIGKCLLDSGSADRIVRAALGVTGERGAPVAFVASGFLLGIPVFFDTVFYLMIPLGKALAMRTGRNYLLYILTIVAGATMAHSLVPPTPGPLLVAKELQIDLGVMILGGCIVGLFSSSAGFLYAVIRNRSCRVELKDSSDFSLAELEKVANRGTADLPPLWLAMLPIFLPVVLIAGDTVGRFLGWIPETGPIAYWVATLANKNIALLLAAAIAMATLIWHARTDLKKLAESIQGALASGGVIILITAAGGAFGAMLKQTGIAQLISDLPEVSPQMLVILAFLITTAVRTAQGSATVAMITAVGILAGLAEQGLPCHPVYLALAIGCGSKPIAWMNDSGFWVICKMSGMSEGEGLRYVTPMSILMGLAGLIATLIGVTAFPMVE